MNRRYLNSKQTTAARGFPLVVEDTANIFPGNGLLAGTRRMFGWKGAPEHTSSLLDCGHECQGVGAVHPPTEAGGFLALSL
jgi:hypothetical protein